MAEGHAAMARIQLHYDWDFHGAGASSRRALELMPGNALALRAASRLAGFMGRFEEAIGLGRRAVEQDPLSAGAYMSLGAILWPAGRFAEAVTALRMSLELAPQITTARVVLSFCLNALGRADEALGGLVRKHADVLAFQIAEIHALRGEKDLAFEALERARALRDSGIVETKINPHLRSLHDDPRWGRFLHKTWMTD